MSTHIRSSISSYFSSGYLQRPQNATVTDTNTWSCETPEQRQSNRGKDQECDYKAAMNRKKA